MFLSDDLHGLIQLLSRLPGLGQRSARRIALHLMKHKGYDTLIHHLQGVGSSHKACHICGYMDARDPCFFCTSSHRDPGVLCIVADTGDVWALEKASFFKGRYHVLGGVLSAFQGKKPEDLFLDTLPDRLNAQGLATGTPKVREVIVAMNGTMEGQVTLNYLVQMIQGCAPQVSLSVLARGMPVGGELDYVDQGTLMNAFMGRQPAPVFAAEAAGWLSGVNPTGSPVTGASSRSPEQSPEKSYGQSLHAECSLIREGDDQGEDLLPAEFLSTMAANQRHGLGRGH